MHAGARHRSTALQFAPPHISIYHLTIEPNTYFAKYPPVIPEDDTAYAMLDRITELTGVAGLDRYEVSAYAKPAHRCKHNLNYWQFGDYLGWERARTANSALPTVWCARCVFASPALYMEPCPGLASAVAQADEVSRAELPFEFMLNALRLRHGFSLTQFSERTGLPLSAIESRSATGPEPKA
jgi:coproporphyrinogen III oxidase-like Fe-S oxidoreductase